MDPNVLIDYHVINTQNLTNARKIKTMLHVNGMEMLMIPISVLIWYVKNHFMIQMSIMTMLNVKLYPKHAPILMHHVDLKKLLVLIMTLKNHVMVI